jgi:hypothetical protein
MNTKVPQAAFKKFFAGKNGKIVIWQKPNFLLIGWFIFLVSSKLISNKTFKTDLSFISFVFLALWAVLEIFRGDSYFRRFLGLVVLVWSVSSRL